MNINDYPSLLNLINQNTQKKVLMHSCCAPCSSTCLDVLTKGLRVDIFYANPNIDTLEEFQKRSDEQIRLNNLINKQGQVIIDSYDNIEFLNYIKGYENLGERSKRCYLCYELRMRKTAKYAKDNGYDYFTTTLSLSPYKRADWINEIGIKLAEEYDIPFLYSNFKLKDGYLKSINFSKQYDLYRQNYCGCRFSKLERGLKEGVNS